MVRGDVLSWLVNHKSLPSSARVAFNITLWLAVVILRSLRLRYAVATVSGSALRRPCHLEEYCRGTAATPNIVTVLHEGKGD